MLRALFSTVELRDLFRNNCQFVAQNALVRQALLINKRPGGLVCYDLGPPLSLGHPQQYS